MKKLFTCLITLLLIIGTNKFNVFSEEVEKPETAEWLVNDDDNQVWYFVNNIMYSDNGNEYVITIGGKGEIPDYVDPDSTGNKSPFLDYSDMKMVTIREGVTGIGDNTFNGCEKLDTIVIKGSTVLSLGENALKDTSDSLKIYVAVGNKEKYENKTGWEGLFEDIFEGYFIDADAIHYVLKIDNFIFTYPGFNVRANVCKVDKYYKFDKDSFAANYYDGEEKTAKWKIIVDNTSPIWIIEANDLPNADIMLHLDVNMIPVAKIGDIEYKTLNEAVDAAKDGDVINIVNRPAVEETIIVDKKITIQSEDRSKIIVATFSADAFNVTDTGKLTIRNFTMNTKLNGISVSGNGGKVILGPGATINAASAITLVDTSQCFALQASDSGEILIDGGAINGAIVIDEETHGKLSVRAGIFSEEVDGKYVYEDTYMACEKTDNTDTKTKMRMPYAVIHEDYVAYNEEYGFIKLEHAINEVNNNETIVLLSDNTEEIEVSRKVKFMIDSDGYAFDENNVRAGKDYIISYSEVKDGIVLIEVVKKETHTDNHTDHYVAPITCVK